MDSPLPTHIRSRHSAPRRRAALPAALLLGVCLWSGCGTTKSQLATEQMLTSNAVDRSVSRLDFSELSGTKVYFDTQFIRNVKSAGFVNSDYIISSLRQQMFAYGCLLQDEKETAEIVMEGRVGVLGLDDHEITYGIGASQALSSAASVVSNAPVLPAVPELSLAKKNEQIGAAKIAVFAYDRETREPLWQSGVTTSLADSDALWVLGAGPFRRGTIYDGMQFAGTRMRLPRLLKKKNDLEDKEREHALVSYAKPLRFGPAPIVEPDAKPDAEPDGSAPGELPVVNDVKPLPSRRMVETAPSEPVSTP